MNEEILITNTMDQPNTPALLFETDTLSELIGRGRDFLAQCNHGLEEEPFLDFQKNLMSCLASFFISYRIFKDYPQVLEVIVGSSILVMLTINDQDAYFFSDQELAKIEKIMGGMDGLFRLVQDSEKELIRLKMADVYVEVTKESLDLFMTSGRPDNRRIGGDAIDPSVNPLPPFFAWVEKEMILSELTQKDTLGRGTRKL